MSSGAIEEDTRWTVLSSVSRQQIFGHCSQSVVSRVTVWHTTITWVRAGVVLLLVLMVWMVLMVVMMLMMRVLRMMMLVMMVPGQLRHGVALVLVPQRRGAEPHGRGGRRLLGRGLGALLGLVVGGGRGPGARVRGQLQGGGLHPPRPRVAAVVTARGLLGLAHGGGGQLRRGLGLGRLAINTLL